MEYNTDYLVKLSKNEEHKSLYKWSIGEYNEETDEQVGQDLIPWQWSLNFIANELSIHDYFQIEGPFDPTKEGKDYEETKPSGDLTGAVFISGSLRPKGGRFGCIAYSMIGTSRVIDEFSLNIICGDDGVDTPNCYVYGGLSFTGKFDLGTETTPDELEVRLELPKKRFLKLIATIRNKSVSSLDITLKNVSGFYSNWSPIVTTNNIKVLTSNPEEHSLINEDNMLGVEPLSLGEVTDFTVNIVEKYECSPMIEEEPDYEEDDYDDVEEHEATTKDKGIQSSLANITRQLNLNNETMSDIKKAVWFLVFGLVVISWKLS